MKSLQETETGGLLVSVGVQSHVGRERSENQDRISRSSTPFGDLFLVADGMGGYRGGSEAAQATIDGFSAYLNAHADLPLARALQQAVQSVRDDLHQRSLADPLLSGMGSTVVLCVIQDHRVTCAHAGDSRAYLVRDGRLLQLTNDHSMMERFIAQGVLTPEQAREHPDASVLTRAIGSSSDVVLEINEMLLQAGDALLLCSDGLWGYARHEEMELITASRNLSESAVADALLNLALEGGGGDNISIQFLRFKAAPPAPPRVKPRSRVQMAVVVSIALCMAVLAVGLYAWNYQHPLSTLVVGAAANPVSTVEKQIPDAGRHPRAASRAADAGRGNPNNVDKLQDDVTKQVDKLTD